MGPACVVVDAEADGSTLWTGSQKPHFARDGVARVLGLPPDKVHGIWVPGPGSYGRNDAGDAGLDAAWLSKAVGRSVRIQGMRFEGHGWDPKGPASVHRARAALDKDGAVIGYVFESKGFSRVDIDTNESDPVHRLAGQLMGLLLKSLQGFGVPAESYGFARCGPARELPRWCPGDTDSQRFPDAVFEFASSRYVMLTGGYHKTCSLEVRRHDQSPRKASGYGRLYWRFGEKLWQPTSIGTQFCSSRPKKADTSSRVHPCRGW